MGSTTWTCVVCRGLGRMGYEGLDKAAVIRVNEVDHPYLEEHSRWAASTVVDADLRAVPFDRPDFSGHVFERCRFGPDAFAAGNLDGVRFVGCDLSYQDFRGCSLDCTEFVGCNLRGARWDEHRRGHVTFERCRHI